MSNNIKNKVSSCCSAPLIVRGGGEWGWLATNHYECTKCGQACDEKTAIEEGEEKTIASQILWNRLTEWHKEWSAAHPDQPLVWPDTLAMLEWKIVSTKVEARHAALEEVRGVVPERLPEDVWKAGDNFAAGKVYGWNDHQELTIKAIDKLIKKA